MKSKKTELSVNKYFTTTDPAEYIQNLVNARWRKCKQIWFCKPLQAFAKRPITVLTGVPGWENWEVDITDMFARIKAEGKTVCVPITQIEAWEPAGE